MIPIQLWRARIGLFNVKCHSADPRSNLAFRLEKLTIPSTAHSPKGDSSPIPSTIRHIPASSVHEHKCAFSAQNSSSDESTTVFVSIKQQQSADGKHFSARTPGSKAVYSLLSSLNTEGMLYSLIFYIGMHVILTGCFSLLGVGSSYFACRAPASSATMTSVDMWRARIGQFHAKCSSRSSLYCSSFLFNHHCRWHRDDAIPPLTTAVAAKNSVPSSANPTATPTSPVSFSCSLTTCSSSWSSVLFSFLPSCSLSYYSGVCRSVLREAAPIILLIAGIISHQLIICAGDIESNPGPIACEWYSCNHVSFTLLHVIIL